MAQRGMLRSEAGARALRVRSVSREEVWAKAAAIAHPTHVTTQPIKLLSTRPSQLP